MLTRVILSATKIVLYSQLLYLRGLHLHQLGTKLIQEQMAFKPQLF